MPRVTSVTDVDCFCVCAEMPLMRPASSRDTRRISSSAPPAVSEELGAFDDADRRLLHRCHGVLRVGLDGLDDGFDLFRRLARALGEPLHFFGNDREATTGLAGGGRLNRRVQRQDVRLLGEIRDQLDDFPDLERGFTETLDPFRGVLDLRANLVHPGDLILHRLRALLRRGKRLLRDLRRLARGLRHFVDRLRHLEHRRGGLVDLAVLPLRRLEEPVRYRLRVCVALVTWSVAELMPLTSVRSL